jgi:hypothetical protein
MNVTQAAKAVKNTSPETLNVVRTQVRDLLLSSPSFRALPLEKQKSIAQDTVNLVSYLAEPEGFKAHKLPNAMAIRASSDPYAAALAEPARRGERRPDEFRAQAAQEGARAAGAFMQAVDFPGFCAALIKGVFHSIVQTSIEQMEAYGKLVADVAKTLNQFRDENVTANQGRDWLVEQFPDTFQIDVDTGEDGEAQPRVRVRDGVDEQAAMAKLKDLPFDGQAPSTLDEDSEASVVQAARTQLATSRQQLLATMVLMGINRIVVTDGRIAAKVMFDFKAQDNFKYRQSATKFDYDPTKTRTTSTGEYESDYQGGERESSYSKDSGSQSSSRDASYYSKGSYKTTSEPVLTLASATSTQIDASISTKANLMGQVDINFKSDYLPLEKMADSFQIGRIQDAARPGQVKATGGRGVTPPATGTTTPPATGATPPAGGAPAATPAA